MKKNVNAAQKTWTDDCIYYVKKDPTAPKEEVEWLRVRKAEFFRIMDQEYEGQKRYFEKLKKDSGRDDAPVIFIESTIAEYQSVQKDRNHADYLHQQAKKVKKLSLDGLEDGEKKDGGRKALSEEMNLTERIELEQLKEALRSLLAGLDETSQMLADIYYLEFDQKIKQKDMAKRLGISPSAVSQRLKVIRTRLQKYKE